jgi:threonine dehydratase
VHTVEPEDFDDTARSLQAGERLRVSPDARSICDALLSESPGRLPFEIHQTLFGPGVVVSDAEVRDAMRFAFRNLKLVVEPGGAVSLAAVLSGRIETKGKTTAVVISGGNVDIGMFASVQERADGA